MCPQASVALSHVEARHRQSVAKLKREFPHAAPLELMGGDRICDKPNDGSGDLGDGDGTTVGSGDNVPAEGEAAVALIEWSQLEDEEKDRVREPRPKDSWLRWSRSKRCTKEPLYCTGEISYVRVY